MKTFAQKIFLKQNSRVIFINAPSGILESLHLPELEIAKELNGEFDCIHVFAIKVFDLKKRCELTL